MLPRRCKEEGPKAPWNYEYHKKNYGLFLYYDPEIGVNLPVVEHLDGRQYWSQADRIAKGWPLFVEGSKYSNFQALMNPEFAESEENIIPR